MFRYLMPADSSYALQLDAVYTLPIRGGGPMDIAPATSLLWMATANQVKPLVCSHTSDLSRNMANRSGQLARLTLRPCNQASTGMSACAGAQVRSVDGRA